MAFSRLFCASLASLGSLGALLVPAPASAQGASSGAPAMTSASEPKAPSLSVAVERVGGIAYAGLFSDDFNDSLSAFSVGVGGPTLNPFAVPRVGVDFITNSGLTLGGGAGFTRIALSSSNQVESDYLGSALIYTLTPRVGYRIRLAERIDLTPRAGVTFVGGSLSSGDNERGSIFAVAVGLDAPVAYRLTRSLNLLAGASADYTVAVSTSSSSGSESNAESVDASLLSVQLWLGLGGYL